MCQLYTGSSNTKLGATVMIVNIVATHSGITEKAADDIFATIKCLLPGDNTLPGSLYQAKTLTRRLGLDFKNIDGCPNGCVLFDDADKRDLERCPSCTAPRFKDMINKARPLKVLRFFPPIPRLQRFFRIPVLSKLMRWHKENESTDGKVRYPADSLAWKKLDNLDPSVFDTNGFGNEITDVRLQISCDGICPFKLHKSTWSAWPVIATILNLPPWLITKKFFTILTLLIPGRQQVPFEHFDVWLRPLIEDLKKLWVGVPAYDVLRNEGERQFKLRAAVLYTTHDYPGYGVVSGCSHQGYTACIPCGNQLRGRYAYESRKLTYRDARRWLRPDHYLRSSRYDALFDGKSERRLRPVPKTPDEQRFALREYQLWLSRHDGHDQPVTDCGDRRGPCNATSSAGASDPNAASTERNRRRPNPQNASQTTQTTSSQGTRRTNAAPSRSRGVMGRTRRNRSPDPSKVHGVKRGSIFYELPYWEVRIIISFFSIFLFFFYLLLSVFCLIM